MMPKQPRTHRHQRTRDDHSTELAEDYVEAIAELIQTHGTRRVTDLTKYFDGSHVTVNRAVARFHRASLVTTEPYEPIKLTDRIPSWRRFHVNAMKLASNTASAPKRSAE